MKSDRIKKRFNENLKLFGSNTDQMILELWDSLKQTVKYYA